MFFFLNLKYVLKIHVVVELLFKPKLPHGKKNKLVTILNPQKTSINNWQYMVADIHSISLKKFSWALILFDCLCRIFHVQLYVCNYYCRFTNFIRACTSNFGKELLWKTLLSWKKIPLLNCSPKIIITFKSNHLFSFSA